MTNNFLPVGYKTLQTINNAKRFNQWMYKTIRPFIYGKVLEIGSGIGNLSELLLKDGFELTLSDYETGYLSILRENFL